MSRLSRNIAYNVSGQAVLLVLSFVSAKFIFRGLGSDVLGIIYFALTVNAVAMAVLELGISTTIVKEVSAHALTDRPYVVRLLRSGALFYWGAYLFAATTLLVCTPWIVEHWIHVETMTMEDATRALRIVGVSALLALPQAFYVSVFRGVQRMGVPNLVDVLTMAAQQLGIIAIIAQGLDTAAVVWWIAAVYAARIAVLLALTSRVYGWRAMTPSLDLNVVRRNRRFALHMMAISLLAVVHMQSDKLLISAALPVSSVGIYGLLYAAFSRGGLLTTAVAQGAFPVLAELHASNNRAELTQKYRRLQDLLCYALVPAYAFIAFAVVPVFGMVFGSEVATDLAAPGAMLAVGFYLNGTLVVPYFLSLAADRPDLGGRLNFFALFATLPVTVILTLNLGFLGGALSWVWYQLFAYGYFIPRVCREVLFIPAWSWYRHVARTIGIAAVSYGLALVCVRVLLAPTLTTLAASYCIATAVYAVLLLATIDPEQRTRLARLVRRSSAS